MTQIHIIDKVKLTDRGLLLMNSQQLAHLRQGELDGACAVYSMMMCLVIERIIKRCLVTDVPRTLKRSSSEGRLVSFFLEKQGMVIDGYDLETLHADLLSSFRKKVDAYYQSIDTNDQLMEEIISWLEDNHPVEISFSRKRGQYGHVLVAIGYMKEGQVTTLYCLDPGYAMETCQIWNNVLVVNEGSTAKYNCYNIRERDNVRIEEMMVCLKR